MSATLVGVMFVWLCVVGVLMYVIHSNPHSIIRRRRRRRRHCKTHLPETRL